MNITHNDIEKLYDSFKEIKAEKDPYFNEKTFVDTKKFNQTRTEGKSIIVGRKGSGKSAFVKGFQLLYKDKYIDILNYTFDSFPYGEIEAIIEENKLKKDSVNKSIYLAWKYSLLGTALQSAIKNILSNEKISLTIHDKLLLEKVNNIFTSYNGDNNIFFWYKKLTDYLMFQRLENMLHLNALFSEILIGFIVFLTSDKSQFSKDDFEKTIKIVNTTMGKYNLKILLTSDKFDDFVNDFQSTNKNKTFFSIDSLVEQLIYATRDIKDETKNHWLELFITIPLDNFLELHLREQLDLQRNNIIYTDWTPDELYKFVCYRFADALNIDKAHALELWYKIFPQTIPNKRVSSVREDSFLYLLRHTLWRPRQLTIYMRDIFGKMLEEKNLTEETLQKIFQNIIPTASQEIINSEFIVEFQNRYTGLNKILNSLRGTTTLYPIVSYSFLQKIIAKTSLSNDVANFDEILKRLFHIGVIGVRLIVPENSPNLKIRQNNTLYCYCYAQNDQLTNDPFAYNSEIIFHPMFFDYLLCEAREDELKHDIVIGLLSWESFNINIKKMIKNHILNYT